MPVPPRARRLALEVADTARGREHRQDAIEPGSGGPAGNARLTAWTGLLLLVLFLAELVTLLDVHGLIGWHISLGTLLVPPALLKTGSTTWRVLRYYTGQRSYRDAGPPPMLLRLLGPLVVLSTVAVLVSGLLLVLRGPDASRSTLLSLLGQRVDWLTLHQAAFAVWAAATGVHVLARLLPAVQLTVVGPGAARRVPGPARRAAALVVTVALAAGAAAYVFGSAGDWRHHHDGDHRPGAHGDE